MTALSKFLGITKWGKIIILRKINISILSSHMKKGIEPIPEISFIEISFDILQKPDTLGYKRDILQSTKSHNTTRLCDHCSLPSSRHQIAPVPSERCYH